MSDQIQNVRLSEVKWLVIASYLVALIIDTINLIGENLVNLWSFMPLFTLMVLFFWINNIQNRSHLITAFFLGLLVDALTNSLLGSHAAIFTLLTFFALRSRHSFKGYPTWHQSIMIGSYFFIYQILEGFFLPLPLLGFWDILWIYLIKAFIAGILWPFFYNLLNWFLMKTH